MRLVEIIEGEIADIPDLSSPNTRLILDKEDCKAIEKLLEREFINKSESPGKEAYPILKAIMDFAK